jgi:soluble cytochrome b562
MKKLIHMIIAVCVLATVACKENHTPAALPQPNHDELLRNVTFASDLAAVAKSRAEGEYSDPVAVVDYSHALDNLKEAIDKAEAGGVDDLIIAGAEAQGNLNAMEFLEKQAEKRRIRRAEMDME